jgi:hypothetical protein
MQQVPLFTLVAEHIMDMGARKGSDTLSFRIVQTSCVPVHGWLIVQALSTSMWYEWSFIVTSPQYSMWKMKHIDDMLLYRSQLHQGLHGQASMNQVGDHHH